MSGSDSKWFASYTVNDLLPKDFKLISVQTTTLLADALKLLRENNIASLPVYDPEAKSYIGFIGIIDIVTVVVLMARVREIVSSFIKNQIPLDEYLNHENGIFAETTVKDVANLSERNPWCPVFEGKPLHSLLDMFSKETNLHRIPIVNNDGEVVGLISQSRLLEWLNEHLPKFAHIGEKKVITSSGPLVFTRASESALDAYTEMLEKKVTGLPVLDSDDKLLACISTSDLKGSSGINLFKDLYLPVKDYLSSRSEQFPREKSLSPVTITPDATVKEALNKFVTNKVHRLFIIGANGKPSSVCSLCDLITSIREW